MSDFFIVFIFFVYTGLVFGVGYLRGYQDAIEQMKKVRSRK